MNMPIASQEVFAGLVGRVTRLFEPYTEAAPIAIAAQFIVAFGNAVGPGPTFFVGETPHHANEFLALVGETSRARKGDSKNIALRAIVEADPDWGGNIASGLSSGEGLIHAVRDPVRTVKTRGKDAGEEFISDAGVSDKRLLVVETEFSGPLKNFARDGNVLSNVLRDAWDSKRVLRTLTKTSPIRATGAHVSVIAHTTPADLSAYLANVEAANGLGNRFLFVLTQRAKLLPSPGRVDADGFERLVDDVRETLRIARQVQCVTRTAEADRLWRDIYRALTADQAGLHGQLLARSEAHVLRLSTLYALSARSNCVDVKHMRNALALWDYVEASTRIIFANRTGNDAADRIRAELLPGQNLTLSELREQVFANHVSAARLSEALRLLIVMGDIKIETEETEGRPRQVITRLEPGAPPAAEGVSDAV